jgi:hypothetical protein
MLATYSAIFHMSEIEGIALGVYSRRFFTQLTSEQYLSRPHGWS